MIRQKITLEVSVMSEEPLDRNQKAQILSGILCEMETLTDVINDVDDIDVIVPPSSEDVTGWTTSKA
ncbi:hypothetical protein LCGC14_2613250 [marine sediment metagenome]|uniref:Uncharacterized protein n=1 Tax=marine sediment metagenome TaxID=412755 RepID=A0A0F9ASZ3_9ZZZZ